MPEIISRKEARALGLKRYFTGEPCKRDHVSERTVSTWHCVECMRSYNGGHIGAKKRYPCSVSGCTYRRWRKKNRTRLAQYEREARKKNPERFRKKEKKKYLNGPLNPKDEMQWLRKNRAQLRQVRSYLRNRPREQSGSSQPVT